MISRKILMIGNSFSISAGDSLANLIASSGNGIKLASAYIGGCPLQKHWAFMIQADTDKEFRPYRYDIWSNANGEVFRNTIAGNSTVNQMLKDDLYDVVTIQQASPLSWRKESYEPYAKALVDRIKECQPQAEIMVQQTWSYCAQDPRLQKGSSFSWGIDQDEMYARLDEAYRILADTCNCRRIPTGRAVQFTRERSSKKYEVISPEAFESCIYPDLPPRAGDVVGSIFWNKDRATGEMKIGRDDIHLNNRGRYLQGCVFAGAIYGLDPRTVTWTPDDIGKSDAAFLRECAYEALKAENLPGF